MFRMIAVEYLKFLQDYAPCVVQRRTDVCAGRTQWTRPIGSEAIQTLLPPGWPDTLERFDE